MKATAIEAGDGVFPTADLERLERIRGDVHRNCMACGDPDLRLEFVLEPENTLCARLTPGEEACSYAGTVHGGLLSLMIDEIATCSLFAHGIEAVTARMKIRYRHPVRPGVALEIRARAEPAHVPRYQVHCQLIQDGRITTDATLDMWSREPETAGPLL
jgi:uncharacterized protein (TIGR00369 family)